MARDALHDITQYDMSCVTCHLTHFTTSHVTKRLAKHGTWRITAHDTTQYVSWHTAYDVTHWGTGGTEKSDLGPATSLENKLFWRLEATADFDGHWLRLGPSSSERLQQSRRRLQTRPSPGEESGYGVADLKVSVDIIDEGKRGTLWMQSLIPRAKLLW